MKRKPVPSLGGENRDVKKIKEKDMKGHVVRDPMDRRKVGK